MQIATPEQHGRICRRQHHPVDRGFTAAMPLGIVMRTYSSIYVSSSLLITLGLRADPTPRKGGLQDGAEWVGPKLEREFELTHNIPV
jgi:hypothetical protein